MNFLNLLRQRNIFGNPDEQNTPSPYNDLFQGGMDLSQPMQPMQPEIDTYDPAARMRELYEPETGASDRYLSALDAMPVRENPSVWKRLLAAGISGATQDSRYGNEILHAPHERDLRDWKLRVDALSPAANIERQNNANMRAIANQVISQEQGNRRLERQYSRDATLARQGDERLKQGTERLKDADTRLEQANERLKIAREVARGGQLNIDDAGNARIIRKDGTSIPVRGEYLSFEEKEAIKTDNAIAKGDATTKRNRVVERIIEDPNNPGKTIRVSIDLDTGEATPIKVKGTDSTAAPNISQLEQGREVVNIAQQVKNSNPRWSKFITIDKDRVGIQRPGILTGPSQEEYDKMYDAIFGSKPPSIGGGRGGGSGRPQTPNTQPTNVPAGKVRVRRKSDGATGTMDANDPKLNSGLYERIQ